MPSTKRRSAAPAKSLVLLTSQCKTSIVPMPPRGGILIFQGPFHAKETIGPKSCDRGECAMAETAPLYDTYMRAPLRFERGEGVWLITETGERYLDFAAGVAVNSLGHAHPHLVAELKSQA